MFFYIVLGLFAISSAWVAFTSLYPMAFDEEFHYGLVQVYSQGVTPFDVERTAGMAQYGAATADPSYLMQYLLSFPYRLLEWIGASDQTIIVTLRMFNVAFVVIALVLFRKSFYLLTKSKSIANLSVAFFSLIPILPVMAGQMNYDNLLLLVVASCLYLTARISISLQSRDHLPPFTAWLLVSILLFGASVKYGYLPIGAAFVLWIIALIFKHRAQTSVTDRIKRFWSDSLSLPTVRKIFIVVLITLGLFLSFKYVANVIEFGKPIPNCETVFDDSACVAYGPWNRNTMLIENKPDDFVPISFVDYLVTFWIPDMIERLTFVVAGPTNDYDTKEPLTLIRPLLVLLTVTGLIGVLYSVRKLWKEPVFWLSIFTFVLYVVPLVVRLYGSYRLTAEPVAINGRYLLPVLPIFAALLLLGLRTSVGVKLRSYLAPITLVVLILILATGGGIVSYFVLAESSWFWAGFGQDSHTFLKTLLDALIIR